MPAAPRPESQAPEPASRPSGAFSHPAGTVHATASAWLGVLEEPAQLRTIAVQPIPAGTDILALDGRVSDTPTRYSVQIGPAEHLDPFDLLQPEERLRWRPWMFLNHHCEPNAVIEGRSLRALRDILPGEGVTFDYNTTEWEMAEPFDCHCGSPRCMGRITGRRARAAERP